jgi:hypothetical protein
MPVLSRKAAPFSSALLCSSLLLLLPAAVDARRASKCSAKSVSGEMTSFSTSKSKEGSAPKSLTINIPSPVKGRHIAISFPDSYSQELFDRASKLSGAERTAFLNGRIRATLQVGEAKLGSKQSTAFTCVALTGRIGELPVVRAPPVKAPPKTSAKTSTPAAGGTVSPPTESGRRRVLDDQGEPKAPPTNTAPQTKRRKAQLPPLPKQVKGGSGTTSDPYRVQPKLGRMKKGIGGVFVKIPMPVRLGGKIITFEVMFTVSQLHKNNINRTAAELSSTMRKASVRWFVERDIKMGGKASVPILRMLEVYANSLARKNEKVKAFLKKDSVGGR